MHMFDYPFYANALRFPQGIEQNILWLFIFLLLLNLINIKRLDRRDLILPIMVHGFGGILSVISSNLFIVLVSWEVLGFSAFYLLWTNHGSNGKLTAYRYLIFQVISALCFFTAIVIHFIATSSLAVQTLVSHAQIPFLIAVMIKTASFPTHLWLTDAYPVAMLEVAPFLTGFTTKVGVLTAFRLVDPILGNIPFLGYIGGITAVIGVFFALQQSNARKLLSYHIISQVGYMTAALGFFGGVASLFHLITHTLYKALLFFVALEARASFGHEDLKTMGGLAKYRPFLAVSGILGAAAISGVPFTSGFASKYALSQAIDYSPVYGLLMIASVGTGVSFIKFIYLIFFAPAQKPLHQQKPFFFHVPLVFLSLVTFIIGLFPQIVVGIPGSGFWNSSSIYSATRTLAISVVVWFMIRQFLIAPSHPNKQINRIMLAIQELFHNVMKSLGSGLLRLHSGGPRFQVVLLLSTFMMLFWLFMG